jgi:hypothetical protein
MNSRPGSFRGRLHEVLERLGDREPSTALEANAVIERIRISKGYLDDETRSELDGISLRGREIILQIFEDARETLAAYTKRQDLPIILSL